MNAFARYAPFIQDFIYSHDWESLRSIQVAAADAIFNTQDNVLLTASTASTSPVCSAATARPYPRATKKL